jgi:hypothetical protein
LDNTNSYSRSKCDNGWCAYLYDLYFEKDQAVAGLDCCGHRHDIEHVVVWVQNGQAEYVSTSAHGNFATYPRSEVGWEGTHAKVVYRKDGASTHCFRLASMTETPENHYGTWQYPDLVSWDDYPSGIRDESMGADFGSASFGIRELLRGQPRQGQTLRDLLRPRRVSYQARGRRTLRGSGSGVSGFNGDAGAGSATSQTSRSSGSSGAVFAPDMLTGR